MFKKIRSKHNAANISNTPAIQLSAANGNHPQTIAVDNHHRSLALKPSEMTNKSVSLKMGKSHYLWITDLQGIIVGGQEDYAAVGRIGLPDFVNESGRLRIDLFGEVDFSKNLRSEIETTLEVTSGQFVRVFVGLRDKFLVWMVHSLDLDRSVLIKHPKTQAFYELTTRELEVVHMLAKNQTERETSIQLNMAVATVRSHRRSIYHKLGVKDRCGLILLLAKHDDL